MNMVVEDHSGKEIHVVLDNLNTHKPKNDQWLKRHPNVHFHFTPTGTSWLNQVECWFSTLTRSALWPDRGGYYPLVNAPARFTSPQQDLSRYPGWTEALSFRA
ncbi:hypothetical protein Sfum_0787 [Syntrophobacter fumaroxidans MPOB]|uniref:Tc1-like transposase DDE domain-containing protein n=1 Tax=Syntrophobacter fumaroxidans (strain DSM 10017 / MPOB) TaxID=335543 RepID=A0LGD3_SYNFM|nr:hypothetical protein Sfum_0787 [Syntrophobacter fumaroxidans MPOB]